MIGHKDCYVKLWNFSFFAYWFVWITKKWGWPWPLGYVSVKAVIKLTWTGDTRHMTCGTWWRVNILYKYQLPTSYCLGKTVFWKYFNKGRLPEFDYLKITATPGLLTTMIYNYFFHSKTKWPSSLNWMKLYCQTPCGQLHPKWKD